MTDQYNLDLARFKFELNELTLFIEFEKERLSRDTDRFEKSLNAKKHDDEILEKWRSTLIKRLNGLETFARLIAHPIEIINGKIITSICEVAQTEERKGATQKMFFFVTLTDGCISDFLIQ